MECARVKELLSEYIDGSLDAQVGAAVRDHVSICNDCKEELASLSAMVEELGSLEPVKAPADFLEKIHERMEPRLRLYRIIRKLFVPFHIKIPLELAAAATMAILVIAVLNIQQTEKIAQIPKVATYQKAAEEPSVVGLKPELKKKEAKESTQVLEEAPEKLSDSKQIMMARKSRAKPLKPASESKFAPPLPVFEKVKVKQDFWEKEPIELVLLQKTEFTDSAYEAGVAMDADSSLERDVIADEKESTVKSSIERKGTAEQIASAANLLNRVKNLIGLVGGRVLLEEYERQTEQLQSIHAEFTAKQYEIFCEKLTRFATLQKPPPALSDKDRETIRVHIRLKSSE
jgi:hypothetical protein